MFLEQIKKFCKGCADRGVCEKGIIPVYDELDLNSATVNLGRSYCKSAVDSTLKQSGYNGAFTLRQNGKPQQI